MPSPLFAACLNDGQLKPRRVRLDGELQGQVEGLFEQQYLSFTEDVEEEIPFTGNYKPDSDELLTIPVEVIPGASIFRETVEQSGTATPELGATRLMTAGVKAIFMGTGENNTERILVQRFTGAQALDRKFLLFLEGDVYRRFTDSIFTLDTSLTFVVENGLVKFSSFDKLRMILDVREVYRSATDAEVLQFASHSNFAVSDLENFVGITDQVLRRSIGAILDSGFLDKFTPAELKQTAGTTSLEIELDGNKIMLPDKRRELKNLLDFLNERRFIGLLSGAP